jgi:hypothetical protein
MTDLAQLSEEWAEVLRHSSDYVKPACLSSFAQTCPESDWAKRAWPTLIFAVFFEVLHFGFFRTAKCLPISTRVLFGKDWITVFELMQSVCIAAVPQRIKIWLKHFALHSLSVSDEISVSSHPRSVWLRVEDRECCHSRSE